MDDLRSRIEQLTPLQRATLAIKELRGKLDAYERARAEPIAIVGIGCRFPSASGPLAFWRLLRDGRDATSAVPATRWNAEALYDPDPDAPGKAYTRRGGFIEDPDRFDADFFNITPREAAAMDPQQRLLLEVSWEALEDAGLPPGKLANTRSAAFVGIGSNDYTLMNSGDPSGVDPYLGTGNGACFAAGRLSYLLGLQGPSVALDTACSSSLVAVHLACMNLRAMECDLALAGGVQLMLAPDSTVFLCRTRALSPDGRCKTFDAAADGYVRSEGCGVVVLKRLSDALRDADDIYAVIRGSSVNHDGPSGGLTVPNGIAQQKLVRQALKNAGVAPAQVQYVEAHGTGTALGDPIEVEALGAVLAEGRAADSPLWIGSLKTNLGHLEAAAGVASLIKVALALRFGAIPAHLHFNKPNPHIPWHDLPVRVATELTAWPEPQPRIAALSAFGLSGTNAHMVLASADGDGGAQGPAAGAPARNADSAAEARGPHLLCLSAKSEPALVALAGRWIEYLSEDVDVAEACAAAYQTRTHFSQRLAVLGAERGELVAALGAFLERRPAANLVHGVAEPKSRSERSPSQEAAALLAEPFPDGATRQGLERLAALYVRGAEFDWLRVSRAGHRVRIPTYPFQRQRHWTAQAEQRRVQQCAGAGVSAEQVAATAPVERRAPAWQRLRATPDRERRLRALSAEVEAQARAVLAYPEDRPLDARAGFTDLGMDSIMMVELRGRLQRELGRELPATIAFDYPSVEVLTRYLAEQLSCDAAAPVAAARRQDSSEPIAIVGMACRIPGGANDPRAYWELLREGRSGIREVPRERWSIDDVYDPDPNAPGKMYTRSGGFLEGAEIDKFDAQFFGISPREAISMDPQQRLLLECAWEALEHAGEPALDLVGSRTGVFVGISSNDYGQRQAASALVDPYSGTGNAASVAAGRVAYVFGFQGPTLSLDTSCSSSLVSIHLACQSLRSGEADLALAGGVNLMLSPEATIYFCKLRALAADGRCKTFDAAADGYSRGEGCALVVLKRLSDALAAGDRIWAVIRGSAVNHDGRSSGLTVPNGPAQQAVIRAALARAELQPGDVSYVEAHGTGTPLGDPIEMQAIEAVFGSGRAPERPLLVASVKANIGHLEAAAGVAGVIKSALALAQRQLPPHVGLQTLNPHLPLAGGKIEIPLALRDWDGQGRPLIAGISSFGISGTNAHVLLAQAPERAQQAPAEKQPAAEHNLLVFSARTPAALAAVARAYREFLQSSTALPPLRDICYSAFARRSHLEHRVSVMGRSAEDLSAVLERFERGERVELPALYASDAPARARKVAFVFSGVGSHWLGMGRGALRRFPTYRAALERVDAAIRPRAGWSVLELLAGDDDAALGEPERGEPCIFAVQVALAELLAELGLVPDAVVGHSLGEVAAAHVAGALELDDAVELVLERSRLRQLARGQAGMLVVSLDEHELQPLLRERPGLCLAALNAPRSLVVAGDDGALDGLIAELHRRNVFCRRVKSQVASHSPAMDAIRPQLERALVRLAPQPTSLTLYSSVTAAVIEGTALDATYWGKNLREPVRFADALRALVRDGHDLFLELSPHPLLLQAVESTLEAVGAPAKVLPTLARGCDEAATMLGLFGALHALGQRLDGSALGLTAGEPVELPAYPWQRKRYWVEAAPRASAIERETSDPLASWLYETRWEQRPLEAAAASEPGHWIIIGAGRGIAAELTRALEARGHSVTRAALAQEPADAATRHVTPLNVEDYARLLAEAQGSGRPFRGVVHATSLDCTPVTELTLESLQHDERAATMSAFCLAQALARLGGSARMWFLTRGAQPAGGTAVEVSQTPLWGLGRVIALENPDAWGGLIDLDPALDAGSNGEIELLLKELTAGDGEDQLAYRSGSRWVARLQRVAPPLTRAAELVLEPSSSYLVTGGLGALGLQVADWLVERGARHLVLLGRRGAPAAGEVSERLDKLRAKGVTVLTFAADVADPVRLRAVLQELAASAPPLRGIVHAAGISVPRPIAEMDLECFEAVVRAKISGTWALHEATRELDLTFVIYFSSLAATLGSALLAPYAAGNHFLDAVARHRQSLGLRACSINWGGWAGEGMTTAEAKEYFEQMGLGVIPARPAFDALSRVVQAGTPQAVVAEIDWARYKPVFEARRRRPLISAFASVGPSAQGIKSELLASIEAASPRRARALLSEFIRNEVGAVLKLEPEAFEASDGFFQLGMDSLMSVALRGRLETVLSCSLPATVAFEHPSVQRLSDFIADDVLRLVEPTSAAPVSATQPSDAALDDLSETELAALLAAELGPALEPRSKA